MDKYALIGHPVDHSHSPVIHRLFAEQTGQSISYELIDATEDLFEPAVFGFRDSGGKGVNITVPHKSRACQLADQLGPEAAAAQAANTLDFSNNRIKADNTDGIGLLRDLSVNLKLELAGKRALILGAGGAARGIIGPLLASGVTLTVANRSLARAEHLQQLMAPHGSLSVASFDELGSLAPPDLLLNATSAGVKGEVLPFPATLCGRDTFCYDLSYSVADTPFVRFARSAGAGAAIQGWGMLVEQAAESFRIWRGVLPDTTDIIRRWRR